MRKFMWVTDAERDMIKILRASDHVTLNISRDGGQWNMRLEDHDSGSSGFGSGPTFDRAWDAILGHTEWPGGSRSFGYTWSAAGTATR